jgi:hypothetical protein
MAKTFKNSRTYKLATTTRKAFSVALTVACSIPLGSMMAMANTPMPNANPTLNWQTHSTPNVLNHAIAPQVLTTNAVHSFAQSQSSTAVHHAVQTIFGTNLSHHAGATQNVTTGVNLNLTSNQLNFLAGNLGGFHSITIDVGGRTQEVSLNTRLTAAEAIAVEQVLTTGTQGLSLNANGTAHGGSVALTNSLLSGLGTASGGGLSSLTISHGVNVVDTLSSVDISGKLINFGTLQTASTQANAIDAINAGTIVNAGGAIIQSFSGGNGYVGADVALTALNSLTNAGTISSANNLNISAPVISNTGAMTAMTGNINFTSPGAINFTGAGTLQANNGNVNFATNNADIYVSNANVLSQQVNFNAGTGDVGVNLGQVNGLINAVGCNIHVNGDTANLKLGNIDASGDPTFTNSGTITIDNSIKASAGQPIALIAGGDIVMLSGGTNLGLDTSSSSGNGGDITLVAGAKFTPPGTSTTTAASTNVVVSGASATGGSIVLTSTTNPINSLTSASSAGNGGNITLIAYQGTTGGTGTIAVPTGLTINSSSSLASAGAVTIIAGASSGTAISTGPINAHRLCHFFTNRRNHIRDFQGWGAEQRCSHFR